MTDNTYTFYAKTVNAAGTASSCSTASVSYVLDTAAPSAPTLSINGGANYATSTTATLTLSATGASQMYITNTAGCGSGGSYEAYATSKGWTLANSNATNTVYVKYKDQASNETACVDDSIIHDGTGPDAPTGLSLGSVPSGNATTPPLSWTAAADNAGGSGIASYQGEVYTTSDNSIVAGCSWTTLTSGSAMTCNAGALLDATQYYMKVRAVDNAGNVGTASVASANWTAITDACAGTPAPGTVCPGGSIYLGSLSPGATVGSGTDKYMTTPGGCGEIPAGQIVGSGAAAYPSADFTPTCSGTDALVKTWNDGYANYYSVPGLINYTTTMGSTYGDTNKDANYGSTNTNNIVAISDSGQGGYHAAARYCNRLSFGGYTDWYLPNRYELNLMNTNKASIPGLVTTLGNGYYWSSTQYSNNWVWVQVFDNGSQGPAQKDNPYRVRCVRKY